MGVIDNATPTANGYEDDDQTGGANSVTLSHETQQVDNRAKHKGTNYNGYNEDSNDGSKGEDDPLKQESQEPSFEIDPVQLQFEIDGLKQLLVKNNIMFLVLDSLIYKIDLNNPALVKLFQFAADSLITNCWLSPNGHHFIVQINQSTYFYLYNEYDKFKVLPRLKGFMIRLIHFPNVQNGTDSTGEVLIVTQDNSIYIANIKSHPDQENKRDDKYVKLIYKQSVGSIIGINFTNNNLTINVFTLNNILQWDCFDNSYNELVKVFKTDPNVMPMTLKDPGLIDNGSAYLLLSTANNSNKIISNDYELSLSKLTKLNPMVSISSSQNSVILSNHHIIALSKDHDQLLIFSKLSNQPPKLIDLRRFLIHGQSREKILGITADYSSNTFWLYSKQNIYELVINNESGLVWYNYYKMGKYDEALKCLQFPVSNTSSNDVHHLKKDMILVKQGYDYLQRGAFGIDYDEEDESNFNVELVNLQTKGIKILAELSEPFEKICLMLMNLQSNHLIVSKTSILSEKLLVEYLMVKFYYSKNVEKNKIRVVVLSSWIIELMLRVIYKLETDLDLVGNDGNNLLQQNQSEDAAESLAKLKHQFLGEFNDNFHTFINLNYTVLDSQTVYQIMNQLNYTNKLIYLAELNKDYEFILNYYIELEEWDNALKILVKMYSEDFKNFEDVIYKKSTILLVNFPVKTVDTWLKFTEINYEKLLPSLLIYNKSSKSLSIFNNYGILFLQKLIFNKNIRNKTINNYYLSLLITYPVNKTLSDEDNDPGKYVNKQIIKFLNFIKLDNKLYDSGFILRLCLDYNHTQPAIIILINDMKLFEPALKLSIDHGLTELAIYVLNKFNTFVENETHDTESGNFSENLDVNLISDTSVAPTNYSSNESVSNVGKNKLHHKNFTQGKKIWLMFAKYLIEGVVKGEEFEILNNVKVLEIESDNSTKDPVTAATNNANDDVVKNLTNDIADLIKPKKVADGSSGGIELVKANKALRYLLDASYNNAINSSFLNLKDLLPLFPESIMVNNFKAEIIRSLDTYNSKINQLSMEMKESLNISNRLNQQIKESNQTAKKGKIFTIIEPGEPCSLCHKLLISKNFISFPNCGHNFHKECLIKHYLMLKGDYRFKKVFHNFKKNASSTNKKELDDIMLSECILCNESNIISIDNNLIGDSTKEQALIKEWVL